MLQNVSEDSGLEPQICPWKNLAAVWKHEETISQIIFHPLPIHLRYRSIYLQIILRIPSFSQLHFSPSRGFTRRSFWALGGAPV